MVGGERQMWEKRDYTATGKLLYSKQGEQAYIHFLVNLTFLVLNHRTRFPFFRKQTQWKIKHVRLNNRCACQHQVCFHLIFKLSNPNSTQLSYRWPI